MNGKWMRAALGAVLLAGLSGCGASLEGRYQDVNDATRYYEFSGWGKSWTNHYGETGDYEIDGDALRLQGFTGIHGERVSDDEIRLRDVASWHAEQQYRVYRRVP